MRFLGEGAMGRVFLARDRRLGREVAIKLFFDEGPEHVRRMLSEGRAQARVDHPRVCKVYEVGEIEGRVYIAMQMIHGEPFGAVAAALTVEQKAMLVRDAALGVHEAHKAGLIHRDIKPGNILVTRTDDGAFAPYVMDFGLARDHGTGSATETGAVVGTPRYMSPEQARGEVSRLDRRADVYSLGATLYEVITGEPPIPGDHALEVLAAIATYEPRTPRSIDRHIPADLEAITLKCLEKDRTLRYDSARALAEDLDRFLHGDPVLARRVGLVYRARRQIMRHRRVAAALAVALVGMVTALAWVLVVRAESADRERLARRFTEQVEHIEAMARYSALSPAHDTRADERALRTKMDALAAEIARAGKAAQGPGLYALGRGHLALGDDDKAIVALQASRDHGFREPRTAYAISLALGRVYAAKIREVERIERPDQRDEAKREIEQRYRDPALVYLRESRGADVPSEGYVAAWMAFYEKRYDDALHALDEAGAGMPWFYEVPWLRGDILAVRARERWNHADGAGALADYDAGRRAYAAAQAVGESVPSIYEAEASLEADAMYLDLYRRGDDVEACFRRGAEASSRASLVAPDRATALVLDARLHRQMAEYRVTRGAAADDLIERAVTAAERALTISPNLAEAQRMLAWALWQRGAARQSKNQDPSADLREASLVLDRIVPKERDAAFHVERGLVFKVWADYEEQAGRDELEHRSASIDAMLAATEIDDQLISAWLNLGTNLLLRASRPRAPKPDADLHDAVAALDRARALSPQHVVVHHDSGQVHDLLAQRAVAQGLDPRPELDAALESYERGVAVSPGLPALLASKGNTLLQRARATWDRGGDPGPFVEQARSTYARIVEAAPDLGLGYLNLIWAFAARASYESARGEDVGSSVRSAEDAFMKAVSRTPDDPAPWVNLGTARGIEAAFLLHQGRDPSAAADATVKALEHALSRTPNDPEPITRLGEALSVKACFLAEKGRAAEADFTRASDALNKATTLAPEIADAFMASALLHRDWARWEHRQGRDPGPRLAGGLAKVSRVDVLRPGFPDATALRASLLLAQAEVAGAETGRRLAADALQAFNRALHDNPNLERAWGRERARAVSRATASR
ncbi:Hypothetical protein A7982_14021 [Minicystis rosea]|nr:Hypothetical protein A7982_14021 [Minicystis rosea]